MTEDTSCLDVEELTFMTPSHERKVHLAKRDSSSFCSISLHACQGEFLREASADFVQPQHDQMPKAVDKVAIVLLKTTADELFRSAHESSRSRYRNPELYLGVNADEMVIAYIVAASCKLKGVRVSREPQLSSIQYPHVPLEQQVDFSSKLSLTSTRPCSCS